MAAAIELSAEQVTQLLEPYLAMQSALAADNLTEPSAKSHDEKHRTQRAHARTDSRHHSSRVFGYDTTPSFRNTVECDDRSGQKTHQCFLRELLLMHCPMVYSDRGADWLQNSEPLQNPYFGAMTRRRGKRNLGMEPTDHSEHAH